MPVTVIVYRAGEAQALPAPVYLDANFLASWRLRGHAKYPVARAIAKELLAFDKEVVISLLAMDEAWWTLLRHWYTKDEGTQLTGKRLKRDPTILQRYAERLRRFTWNWRHWPGATFLAALDPGRTIDDGLRHLTTEQLTPRDAFHLAFIQEADARSVITSDSDFDNLQLPAYELTVLKY